MTLPKKCKIYPQNMISYALHLWWPSLVLWDNDPKFCQSENEKDEWSWWLANEAFCLRVSVCLCVCLCVRKCVSFQNFARKMSGGDGLPMKPFVCVCLSPANSSQTHSPESRQQQQPVAGSQPCFEFIALFHLLVCPWLLGGKTKYWKNQQRFFTRISSSTDYLSSHNVCGSNVMVQEEYFHLAAKLSDGLLQKCQLLLGSLEVAGCPLLD